MSSIIVDVISIKLTNFLNLKRTFQIMQIYISLEKSQATDGFKNCSDISNRLTFAYINAIDEVQTSKSIIFNIYSVIYFL